VHLRQGELGSVRLGSALSDFHPLMALHPFYVTCLCAVDRPTIDQLDLREAGRMGTTGLVIFDAFNTLVTSRRGSEPFRSWLCFA
jgi:hypothetical protein